MPNEIDNIITGLILTVAFIVIFYAVIIVSVVNPYLLFWVAIAVFFIYECVKEYKVGKKK